MRKIKFKKIGPLMFCFLMSIVYLSLPIDMVRVGGLPLENFLYLITFILTFINIITRKVKINYILFLYIIIVFLVFYGYLVSRDNQYFTLKFLFQDLLALSGILVGYTLTQRYEINSLLNTLYRLCVFLGFSFLLSFVLMDLGFLGSKYLSSSRKYIPNQYYIVFFLYTLLPFIFYYFKEKGSVMKQWYMLLLYVFIFTFAIRSGTRSTLILTVISLLGLLYFNKLVKKSLIPAAFILVLGIPAFMQTNVFQRLQNVDKDDSPRYFEILGMQKDFESHANPLFGFGLGVGLVKPELSSRGKGVKKVVYTSHVGILTFAYKGGLLFFLTILFPFFLMLQKILMDKKSFYGILFFVFLMYYFQSTLSGGYSFSSLSVIGLALGLVNKLSKTSTFAV